MKKTIELKEILDVFAAKHQKEIKLDVEGKFAKDGSFSLKLNKIILSKDLANQLGFEEKVIETIKEPVVSKKQPTIRELIMTIATKVDSIDKRLARVEVNQKFMMNTPTMKKELNQTKTVTK